MGKLTVLAVAAAALAAITYFIISAALGYKEFSENDLPDFYWGPKDHQAGKQDTTIYPFSITVDDKLLDNLRARLRDEVNSNRESPPLEGIGFQYGFNSKYLETVTNYWLNKYNWRSREKLLNKYPQFRTKIAGLNIHFQHVRSSNGGKYKETRPLLLIHGWPGSFVEFQKIIPMLTDPVDSDINFELIIPSLPGYGFSDAAVRPGLGPVEVGQLFVKLMKRLGHEKFYVQGGDWGAIIAADMAAIYRNNVVAMHSNMCASEHPRSNLRLILASLFPSLFVSQEDADKALSISSIASFILEETGYIHIQATKPDTVGIALTNSPSGLAAYILEKFSTWTNIKNRDLPDGGLTSKFTMDELLDNIMVYWITSSITTSMRIYSEAFSTSQRAYEMQLVPVRVPAACLVPLHEPYVWQTKEMIEDRYLNLKQYSKTTDGGHFFALEHPDVLSKDVVEFVKKVEMCPEIKKSFKKS